MVEYYYKYRDLRDLSKFIDIIMNKRLFMASYKDFNDPSEGYYLMDKPLFDVIRRIREEKEKLLICCLSKNKKHSLLWSHYADGHKGVCIEVKVPSKYKPVVIKYEDIVPKVNEVDNNVAQDVLSYKSKIWEYENEVRIFKRPEGGKKVTKYLHVKVLRVYLGVKMDRKQVGYIKKLVKSIDENIEVVEMKKEDVEWGYKQNADDKKE